MSTSTAAAVFVAGIASVVAAGLGTLPAYVVRSGAGSLLGAANGFASGVMASVSLGLALEGAREDIAATAFGVGAGIALIVVVRAALPHERLGPGSVSRSTVRGAALVVVVMTAHSFAEGIAVGSAFAAGESLGMVTAIAITAHKAAEGFAIGLVLVSRGTRLATAAGWSMVTALPQPIVAVPAFVFAGAFTSVLPLVLGLAAGAMSGVVALELLPEARRRAPVSTVGLAAGAAFVVTVVLQATLGS